ncbi:MAG: Eco57I restriction-modification methylase domain-containing protein [Nitrospirota bacterium]
MNFSTIRSEGAIIPYELLSHIQSGEVHGQRASDFGLDGKIRLSDEIAACWSDARAYWESFMHGLGRTKQGESGATPTREQWILPLLRTLGFDGIMFAKSAAQVGGETYYISHRLGNGDNGLPIHIEGAHNGLDRRPPTGRPRISPHALVQEYLNRTEHLWGIVTNGYQFRILRDSERLSRPVYLEFDLKQIMEGGHFSEFQIFYRLIHRTRWPRDIESAHECLLEQYYQYGIETGGRVREHLRDGVEEALKIFGNGFLSHPNNHALREKIQKGDTDPDTYYRQVLRLVYRFLFLMVSEDRNLVGPDRDNDHFRRIYDQCYNITRLREKVERPINPEDNYWDLWEGVKQTFRLYSYSEYGKKLGITPLNGDLFGTTAMPDLEDAYLYNHDFLRGFAHLSLFKDERGYMRINYAYLDVEELGSVYESLLDYHPIIQGSGDCFKFRLASGTERKSTGSYYTRPELVNELIRSALVPVMEDRINRAETKEEREEALLSLKVCDPASGSGHFLLAAARRIGKELAKIRTGEDQPTPTEFRQAVRDVIQHCIYGVDLNPLAVDLCKVALWLEGHNRGYPLTFLDHRIKCGNSLIGLDKLERLKSGIPDDAFKPVTGDDKEAARRIKAINRGERRDWEKGQLSFSFDMTERLETDLKDFADQSRYVDAIAERSPEDVARKQERYQRIRTNNKWWRDWTAANIWTAAFFYPLIDENDPAIPTHARLIRYIERPNAVHGQLVGKASALGCRHRFFHWPLEFPEIAEAGGFDLVLGNPPWERIKLQEQEFFATRDTEIAQAQNKAERVRFIKRLQETNPELYHEFQDARHHAESNSRFVRNSERFPLTGRGDVNTYALFAELSRRILNNQGRTGIIVPTGIATDDTCKLFFSDLNKEKALVSLFDFENREAMFPGVHRSYKFSLLTTSGKGIRESEYAFFLTRTEHLDEGIRRFRLSPEDIELINPNTKTTPVFRTKVDAELTKKIYQNLPVLINEKTGENLWDVRFMTMFHMSNDSHLFYTESGDGRLPLYEAKMIWQFDHRFGSYDANREVFYFSSDHKKQADLLVRPRYWIEERIVNEILKDKWNKKWLLGFRNITNATNERTSICTIIPKIGIGHSMPLIFTNKFDLISLLLSNLNSITFDYIVRQKLGGTNFTYGYIKQLPVIPPQSYSREEIDYITPRVLELVYTAWDLQPFAQDMGYDGPPFQWDEDRRALLRAELDACYAKLYSLTRDELRYILDPQDVYGDNFPGETFRVLKEKETRRYGEYRTRGLVLEAWDNLFGKERYR